MKEAYPGFTDLHTHILPGVDDGAADLSQALAMLDMAYRDGTRRIFLTPHHRRPYRKSPEELQAAFASLRGAASERYPDLELYLGCEVAFFHEAPRLLETGELLCLNGTEYVLTEFSPGVSRTNLFHGIDRMLEGGYVPVFAHAERCTVMTPQLAAELVRQGVLLQINAGSILGRHGLGVMFLCHKLLKAHLVFCVASDAHNTRQRAPLLQRCFKLVRRRYGRDYAHELFVTNAQFLCE